MPSVTFQPSGNVIEIAEGSTLLAAIRAAGEKLSTKCDGKGECGACHVYVQAGRKSLSKIEKPEHEKLDTIVGVATPSRLACQAKLGAEPVTVEILSFI